MIFQNRALPASSIKLLVFDLDGTLVDSKLDLSNAINSMLRHYQRPELPVDIIATYIGDGANMLVRRALGDPRDEHFVQQALDFFIRSYREHALDNTLAYDGILDALHAIRDRTQGKVKMAVLTNKPVRPSERIVKGLGMDGLFVKIYGGNSFETKKPDPLGAITLLRELGVLPEEAVMIGDSQNDVLTARNSGMWSVGVTYGFSPESLQHHPPDILLDSPHELVAALGYAESGGSVQSLSPQGITR